MGQERGIEVRRTQMRTRCLMRGVGFEDLSENLDGCLESSVGSAANGKEKVVDYSFDILAQLGGARIQHAIFDATW